MELGNKVTIKLTQLENAGKRRATVRERSLEGVGGVDGGVDVEGEEHVEGGDESERVIFFKAKVLHTEISCLCIDIPTLPPPPPPLEVSPTIGGIAWGKAGWLHSTTTRRLAPLQSILEPTPTLFEYYELCV